MLNVIEKIELTEDLPHVTLNGIWVKRSPEANKPYWITYFNKENIDECLAYADKLGFNTIYHAHPFKNWGHFDLIESEFPNGRIEMKKCVKKAEQKGIRIGVHTLTNFITTNDAYVTPVPNRHLMTFCRTKLSRPLSANSTEIYIENPKGMIKNTNQTDV